LGFRQALIPYRTVAINNRFWDVSPDPTSWQGTYGTGQDQPYGISCSCVQRREITWWCDEIVYLEVLVQDQRYSKGHTEGYPSEECADDVEAEVGLPGQLGRRH
jgi:hypothetical protein